MGCLEELGNLSDGARGGPDIAPSNHKHALAAFRIPMGSGCAVSPSQTPYPIIF
jgi:hypothetical protein